jgi:hypothetical protein
MGALIRAFDWSCTSIGPIDSWSPALRMMVRFLLANRFPMLLWWGPHYVGIYNDPYRPILGKNHPWGLGRPVRECSSEICTFFSRTGANRFEEGDRLSVVGSGVCDHDHSTE